MAGQGGIVGEDAAVPHHTVVGDMAIGHDQAVVADHGLHTIRRALVDCGALPDGGVVPDMHGGFLPLVFQVLWHGRNDRPGKDIAVFADPGTFHDRDIGADPGPFPDSHIVVYGGKGLDDHIFGDLGSGVDIC